MEFGLFVSQFFVGYSDKKLGDKTYLPVESSIMWWRCLWALLWLAAMDWPVRAQESTNLNIPLPTMGGQQLWTDHRWSHGWRVQHNAWTDHWRVLDNSDVRRAWGSRQACIEKLEEHAAKAQGTPAKNVVVLLHGLMRSRDSMQTMAKAFEQTGHWQAITFGYASTQDSIEHHAEALREFVDNLPGKPRVAFVGHSLGNIVLRRTIALWNNQDPAQVLGRMHRVVMLGPPNQGSSLARQLSGLGVFETITGTSGQELGVVWQELQSKLATPACPFCIVAGELPDSPILKNPLLEGKGDLIVSVEETRLPGAAQTVIVPVVHSTLMTDPDVIRASMEFIDR